jgi:hypothetical protein
MNNNDQKIINTWINNSSKDILNDEILLLVFKTSIHSYHQQYSSKVKQFFFNLFNKKSYQIFDMKELENLSQLEEDIGKKNIILLGYQGMSIDKITNINLKILLLFKPMQSYFNDKTIDELFEIDYTNKPYIHTVLIENINPVEIIDSNSYTIIYNHLIRLFNPIIFNQTFPLFCCIHTALESDRTFFPPVSFLKILDNDLHILLQKKQLTSRLAIAIYKASTLKFNANNTEIGTFFRKELGVKSKAYKLPEPYPQIVKAYDLNKRK